VSTGRQINAFLGEQVSYLAAIGWVRFRGDVSVGGELPQTIARDVQAKGYFDLSNPVHLHRSWMPYRAW
jgi:hypothetical protein